MSENSINPISNAQAAAVSSSVPKPQVKKLAGQEIAAKEKASKQLETGAEQSTSSSNVSVHFRVDDQTNELTVFVVDRENKKVLRTIPASEFSKLKAGDILQLTA